MLGPDRIEWSRVGVCMSKCCYCRERESRRFGLCEYCRVVILEEFRIQIDQKSGNKPAPKPKHEPKLRLEGDK